MTKQLFSFVIGHWALVIRECRSPLTAWYRGAWCHDTDQVERSREGQILLPSASAEIIFCNVELNCYNHRKPPGGQVVLSDVAIVIPGDDPPQLQGSPHLERLKHYGEV